MSPNTHADRTQRRLDSFNEEGRFQFRAMAPQQNRYSCAY